MALRPTSQQTRETGRAAAEIAAALLVVAFGLWLRLDGLDWDAFAGLHPDERHMVFTVTDALIRMAEADLSGLALWFDTAASPLNPRADGAFYVYGDLPHNAATLLAWWTGTGDWDGLLALGRSLTAGTDGLTVLLAWRLGRLWGRSAWSGLAAAAFYAGLPVAVQTAHFFTVDPFLALFCAVTLAGLSGAVAEGRGWGMAGVGMGCALACKISALAFGPLLFVAGGLAMRAGRGIWRTLGHMALAALVALVTFRLASPFSFDGLLPDERYVTALMQLDAMAGDWPGAPPNWSWVGRMPVLFPLRDLVLFGYAPGIFAALLLVRWRKLDPSAILGIAAALLVLGPMLVHGAPAMRYALPAGAAMAGLAGLAAARAGTARAAAATACLAVTLVMGDAVRRMLVLPHTRIEASLWIWQNVPKGGLIVNETAWDEGLPVILRLPGETERTWPFGEHGFAAGMLELTDPPSPEKARRMAGLLASADLIVESSARMSGSIPRLGGHRPVAEAYYRLRDAGELCIDEVAGFRRGLPVLGLFEIDDSFAQELWTVYDHPTVRLFRPLPCADRAGIEARLMEALPPEAIPLETPPR